MTQVEIHEIGDERSISSLSVAIAEHVRVTRLATGRTLREVADATRPSVAFQHLSALETGKKEWRAKHLQAVAHALGVDPRALLPGPPEADTGAPRAIPNPAPAPPLSPAERALLDAARAGDGAAAVVALARFFTAQPDGKDGT